jgi:chromosome segregation ATPase
MFVSRKYIVIIPVSLTLLMTSCNDSKVAQCERLTKQVNEGTTLIEKNKGSQVTTSIKLSKDLENVTKKTQELSLKDPKLKDYQNKFIKIFETMSQNIAKAAKALSSAKTAQASVDGRTTIQKAREQIDSSLQQASVAAKQSDSIATELNKYCSLPESSSQ